MMIFYLFFYILGAYIFRTSSLVENPTPINNDDIKLEIIDGNNIKEIRQEFSSWAKQIIRLRENSAIVEFEYTIGIIYVK